MVRGTVRRIAIASTLIVVLFGVAMGVATSERLEAFVSELGDRAGGPGRDDVLA